MPARACCYACRLPLARKTERCPTHARLIACECPGVLQAIDDYNNGMNKVDVWDQLAAYYGLDGTGWRDKKWWHLIAKSIIKGAADQGYVCYRRCIGIENKAVNAAARERAAGSPSGRTR